MSVEQDEIAALVRRACSVDGKTGKVRDGYIAIYGGASSRRAAKLAAAVSVGDEAETYEQVMKRLSTARAEGPKKLYVRHYETGDSSPADVVVLDGDPAAARSGEDIESGEGTSLASAHADVVRTLAAENRWLNQRIGEVHADTLHLVANAAAVLRELEVRAELGWQGGLAESVKSLAPTLEKALPESMRIYYQHQRLEAARLASQGRETEGATLAPEDRARRACARLERAVLETATALMEINGEGAMSDALRMEVGGRLSGLIAQAQQGLAEALAPKPAPKPEPEPEPEPA